MDYLNQLRSALLGTSKQTYEQARQELMTKLGYETFRELQRSVFKELGSVDTTGNCICASCCVVRTAMAHGTLASPQPLKHGRQIHITEGPEGPHAY